MSAAAEKALARYRRLGEGEAELVEAIERARVVGVLDAWAAQGGTRSCELAPFEGVGYSGYYLTLHSSGRMFPREFKGHDADAARAAAAKAIESGEV